MNKKSILIVLSIILLVGVKAVYASDQLVFKASEGFSKTQGENNWYYQEWNGDEYVDMYNWEEKWVAHVGTETYDMVGAVTMHPGENVDSVRTFLCPYAGKIKIKGMVTAGEGNGVIPYIFVGDELVWGGKPITPQENREGAEYDLKVNVKAGARIYFRLNCNGQLGYDSVAWDPSITYSSIVQAVEGEEGSDLINVFYNGEEIIFDQMPMIVEGSVYGSFRKIFELMGATVEWDETTQTVTAVKGNKIIKLQNENNTANINGKEFDLKAPIKMVRGRIFVPVRFVSEAMDASVGWDNKNKTVYIYKTNTGLTEKTEDGKIIIYIKDFKNEGLDVSLQTAINTAVSLKKPVKIMLEKTEYRLSEKTKQWTYMNFESMQNFSIDGNGARLIFNPNNCPIVISDADNITLENFEIDFSPLPFSQGTVSFVNGNTITVKFDQKLPSASWMEKNYNTYGWGYILPIDRYSDIKNYIEKVSSTGELYSFTIEKKSMNLKAGDKIGVYPKRMFLSAEEISKKEGIEPEGIITVSNSSNIMLKNITIYSGVKNGVVIKDNDGSIIVDGIKVIPLEKDNRKLSVGEKAILIKNNRVGPEIKNCLFKGLFSDAIEIINSPQGIINIIDNATFELPINSVTNMFKENDTLKFINNISGESISDISISSIELKDSKLIVKVNKGILTYNMKNYALFNLDLFSENTKIENNKYELLTGKEVVNSGVEHSK